MKIPCFSMYINSVLPFFYSNKRKINNNKIIHEKVHCILKWTVYCVFSCTNYSGLAFHACFQELLMKKVKMELQKWNDTLRPEKLPKDALKLSYWVTQNIPLDDSLKLHLLSINSAIQRLRCALQIMAKVRLKNSLVCATDHLYRPPVVKTTCTVLSSRNVKFTAVQSDKDHY